mgnify:CR=1 FL=1
MKLLVVEDERMLCDTIAKSLHHAGYEVDCCYDGAEALERLLIEQYDLIVLDLHLPGMDGMEVLERLRQTDAETKVLILSARSQVADKVAGLDAGANDYLEKPFHLQELAARVRSLTRRQFIQQSTALVCGGISFDTRTREPLVNGKEIRLKGKGHFGISAFAPGQTNQSGGADGACLGRQCGCLQQFHSGAYFCAAKEAEGRAEL